MTKPVFIDANVLVADSSEAAPFHAESERLLDRLHASDAPLYISRQILREVAATLTRPQAWTPGVPAEVVAKELARYIKLYRIAEESPASTEQLLAYIQDGRAVGRQVHDANIVAVMKANKIGKLATLNARDFARFRGEIEMLTP
jgi:predicted nucleic acid-binding protein